MLLKKAPFGLSNKKKYDDFQSEIHKKKGWVPSPDKYKLEINWLTQSPKQKGAFLKKPRITFSGEVVAQTAKENRPSPSTYDYLKDDRWKKLS